MSTVLVEMTDEERDALHDLCVYGSEKFEEENGLRPSTLERSAMAKLRDAEPTDKERVR